MTVTPPGSRTVSPRPGVSSSSTRPIGRHADRERRGDRGQQIGPQVRLAKRGLELDSLALGVDHDALLVLADHSDVTLVAERDRSYVGAQVGVEQPLAGGHDRDRPRRQRGDQLGLRGGDVLDRAQQLQMDRADADDHRDVGLGDRRQLGDLAGSAHRHLEHQHLGARRRREDLERDPDLGVVVGPRGDRPPLRGEQRRAAGPWSRSSRSSR